MGRRSSYAIPMPPDTRNTLSQHFHILFITISEHTKRALLRLRRLSQRVMPIRARNDMALIYSLLTNTRRRYYASFRSFTAKRAQFLATGNFTKMVMHFAVCHCVKQDAFSPAVILQYLWKGLIERELIFLDDYADAHPRQLSLAALIFIHWYSWDIAALRRGHTHHIFSLVFASLSKAMMQKGSSWITGAFATTIDRGKCN